MMAWSSPTPPSPQGRPHGCTVFHTVIARVGQEARQQARRAESLSGSIRQFLTPEVWKQARQAAHAAGCRNDPRWSLQPLILTWAMMTWCAGQTDAERFLTVRHLLRPRP